jgi:toxin YhaV
LRAKGSQRDPYTVFQNMLDRGNPPDDWDTLLRESSKRKIK